MPSRAELNLRAYAMGFDPAGIANDSKLEQKVIWLESNQTAAAISATAPTTTLTSTGTFADADTITVGGVTYTMKTAINNAIANQILIGAAATNSLDNIKDAINGTQISGNAGTIYSQPTKRNPLVTAGVKTATSLVVAPTDTNVGGSTATTKSAANFAWTGATMSAGTLGGIVPTSGTTVGTRDTLGAMAGGANVSL